MGCVSSKLIARTGSFKEETSRMFHEVGGLEELLTSQNAGDRFLALLSTANAVSQKLRGPPQEPEPGPDIVNTINTWELLADLEEDETRENPKIPEPAVVRARSFHTVEEYDALVARTHSLGEGIHDVKECIVEGCTEQQPNKRQAMAKDLAALRVPGFEFSRSGSLRDWLRQGAQVFSPGSYVTPKFGRFAPEKVVGDGEVVFDPEMVAHFEEAMKYLTVEEECIIEQILESLGSGNEVGISSAQKIAVEMQV